MKSTSTIPTHRRLSTMAVGAAAALIMGGFGLSAAHAETTPAAPVTASANQTASATLAENLAFSREEERLARDLYQLFADTYDQARPFSNIVKSEQRHFDAVGTLPRPTVWTTRRGPRARQLRRAGAAEAVRRMEGPRLDVAGRGAQGRHRP